MKEINLILLVLLLISTHFRLDNNLFFHFCPQIKADKLTKNGSLYFVKWVGINNHGNTWEPKEHLIGDACVLCYFYPPLYLASFPIINVSCA